METTTFTYLGAKCEYNIETKNLHVISKQSFNSSKKLDSLIISKKHNIQKQDIKSITFKHNNTKLPAHLSDYFSNYPNLESIELEKLDFENVETINKFIYRCPKLKEITIAHKNAENLISIKNLIVETKNTKSITIKNINTPNLKEVKWLFYILEGNIENITIEDITAPNIKSIDNLIYKSPIKTLDLTKLGNTRVQSIHKLIISCNQLETLKLNPITNTKEIGIFIQMAPALKTKVINKINKIEKLDPHFLHMTTKNEPLDLNKFEDIAELTFHLNLTSTYPKNQQYPSIKIGQHKINFSEYSAILENNIPIIDKTEKEIVKEIITHSKNEAKKDIENFLTTLENKKIFKDKEYEKQLKSKLTIIKNLK